MSAQPELWLRGPVDGVDALLQPAAPALLRPDLIGSEQFEGVLDVLARLRLDGA